MEDFTAFMRVVLDCFDQPFTLFGFNLSWWQVFLWSILGSIAAAFIGGMPIRSRRFLQGDNNFF